MARVSSELYKQKYKYFVIFVKKVEKCYVCNRKSNFKHLDRYICRKCFLKNVEKRIKKHLRNAVQQVAQLNPPRYRKTSVQHVPPRQKMFKRKDKILVIGEIEKVLLEEAVGGMPLKITFRKSLPKETKKYDWIVIGKTMDEIDEEFLQGLSKGKLVLGKMKKKFFNILEPLTEEEAKKYAELKYIKLKAKKKEKILDGLKEFKEIKYNLYKNVKVLRGLQ